MDTIKKMINTFAYIMTGSSLSCALFLTIFAPKLEVSITLLWQIAAMSFVCALGNLIFSYKKVPSKKQMIIRTFCHYIYINAIVYSNAFLCKWLAPGLMPEILVMLLLVAVVYVIIMIVNFRNEEKIANSLNRQLRKQYPKQEDDEL
jgi:hypothetical protein